MCYITKWGIFSGGSNYWQIFYTCRCFCYVTPVYDKGPLYVFDVIMLILCVLQRQNSVVMQELSYFESELLLLSLLKKISLSRLMYTNV